MRTATALVRLRGCAGSPEPSLVAHVISTIISRAGSFSGGYYTVSTDKKLPSCFELNILVMDDSAFVIGIVKRQSLTIKSIDFSDKLNIQNSHY